MSSKLQELTQKLYTEGVEKAKTEAASILEKAEEQKKELLIQARQEAESIVNEGQKKAEQLIAKGKSELAMAGKQSIATLKQTITNLLSSSVLQKNVNAALEEKEFIKQIITDLVTAYKKDGSGQALKLVLASEKKQEFEAFLTKALQAELKDGMEINFSERMKNGFKIEAKDGSYQLSFTGDDFEQFFISFVKEKMRDLLFQTDQAE